MAQHTIDLPCIASTWFDSANPNTSHGTDLVLQCGDYASRYMLIALRFNTSLIPAGKRIVSAVLNYYVTSNFSDKILYRYITSYESWTEDSTYNTNSIVNAFNSGPTVNYAAGSYQQLTLSPRFAELGPNGIALQVGGMNKTLSIQSRRAANPPFITVVYEDVPPSAPTPKSPIGVYKDSKSVTRFEWQYNSDVGGEQKAFDLQWSTDQVNWTTVSQTTANNYYDMPADTLPAGNIYWRVRTYNEYDEVGPYCDIQSFYAVGAPAAPVLNAIPSNTARPLVTWNAFNQQIYQLQVLQDDEVIYDSGEQPGINIRQHKIKAWLEDGEYTVQLRIKDEYDMWSEWSSAAVTISTVKPVKPTLTAQKTSTGIKLTVPVGRMLIYRDGMCIGETSTGEYIDNAVANGKDHEYVVRAIEGYPERQITNLLGEDGDCEDTSKWSVVFGNLSLDATNKVFGSNSIKLVSDTSANEHMIVHDTISAKPNSYYMLSAYIKPVSNSAFLRIVIFNSDSVVDIKAPDITDTSKFTRAIIKVQTGALAIGIQPRVKTEYTSTIIYVDGVMLNEISESDYYTLTDDQLLAKYPFGNNTFMAPAIETFTDSDPVTVTAEFSHALIAPVSDLSDVFTFSRSLNTPPKRTYNLQPGGAFVEYAGRKHPVWEPTEHVSAAWAMAFFLKSWNDVEAFIALVDRKETVLYRDAKGRKVYGVLGNLSVTDERGGHMVSFTLTEVDYNEELEV